MSNLWCSSIILGPTPGADGAEDKWIGEQFQGLDADSTNRKWNSRGIEISEWEEGKNEGIQNMKLKGMYGKEIILDIHNCNPASFTRKSIRRYLKRLCFMIDMERCKLCWWDDLYTPEKERETEPHLKGTTAVQFIKTSNITIHTLDILKKVFINIFSCKDFDENIVVSFSEKWFEGKVKSKTIIGRV